MPGNLTKLPLERERSPKKKGELEFESAGRETEPKSGGGVAPDFDSRFGEIEATGFGK